MYCRRAFTTASEDFDLIGMKLRYNEYKSAINNAWVCPLELLGKYIMSIDIASLGFSGSTVLSFPSGVFLHSTFLEAAHVRHALQIF